MKRSIWIVGCLLVLAGAWYFWPAGVRPVAQGPSPKASAGAAPKVTTAAAATAATNAVTVPLAVVKRSAASTNREFFRLTNTKKTLAQLTTSPRAIILENALVDTAAGLTLNIPKPLRATGEPGAYIVQSRGVVDQTFRRVLAGAGAQIVSYIPNNAYLVQVTSAGANALSGYPQVQAVLPYQPYFKVQSSLLGLAINQKTLPHEQVLTLGLFPNGAASTVAQIEQMGGKILGTDHSPFGPVVRVLPDPHNWVALAQLPGVQRVEPATRREIANDLARVKMGIATDFYVTNANWLNLSGSNVLVEVNDTGIDANHPDFGVTGQAGSPGSPTPSRIVSAPGDTNSLYDVDGHGTHVAGVIAGNGSESYSVTNTPRGSVTNADFRGKAPAARLFSFGFMGANDTNVYYSDSVLQEIPALTNALISNNSWVNGGDNEYDLSAASYDAAVRDALPYTNGPQPVLFVFPAGNDGSGNDDGYNGVSDTILSPGTAKNVITVGSLEQYRDLTNTYTPLATTNEVPAWQGETSSSDAVAGYSARGNVGIQTEGPYGRFKPDVVAPGTFVVSTRSTTWDKEAYYNPTNYHYQWSQYNQVVTPEAPVYGGGIMPTNPVALNIFVKPNKHSPNPFPTNFPIYFSLSGIPSATNYDVATSNNVLSIPPGGGSLTSIAPLINNTFACSVVDPTNVPVNFDLIIQIVTTNDDGNLLTVLSNLNETIGPWYYYETGTSIAAPAVSGSLALMQDFFVNTLHTTPSPALLKAMLINGARLTSGYNYFAITNSINDEGWGLVNVPNSIPMGLTNTAELSTNTPMYFLDQSPTNALATGDSRTYKVSVPTPESQSQLMRITLAWTDPPGNPAAGIKLVNDLDLIVTNLDTGDVYYGNTFGSAATPYSLIVDTNADFKPDSINNVENIWLTPPLGTNYAVTVFGRNVTVNAVTLDQTNVVQDFALVVSCGDGDNTNGIMVTPETPTVANSTDQSPKVTFISSYTNGIYFNQLAGANAPWLSTNDVAIDPLAMFGTNAQLFVGQTNQWHFYVVTNTTTYTNAAFITFLPNTLSTPRMGVFEDSTANSTRPEADLNLFASSEEGTPNGDPNAGLLTNIDLTVISNCVYGLNGDQAALARGGTKFIAYSNSVGQQVYYIGVQCQDQMAAEYGFLAVFSELPFSQMQNGNQVVNGLLLPMPIPDGNNTHPGVGYVFGLALYPMDVGGITVTNTVTHQNYGDLVGSLTHGSDFAVLNNHDGSDNPVVNYTSIYNDDGLPGTAHTAGPGSLRDFRGKEAVGPWLLTEVDDAATATGSITGFTLNIEPHKDLTKGIRVTIQPGSWYFGYVDSDVGYTNLFLAATNLPPTSQPPIQMYLRYKNEPDFTNYLVRADLTNCLTGVYPTGTSPGNIISYGPPLEPGRYFVGLYNPDSVAHDVYIIATLSFDASAISKVNWGAPGPVPLIDNAVMYDSQFVTNRDVIQGINVGLRVDHPRISDLVFTLISPDGTRYLLMENRGGQSTNGAGSSVVVTNIVSVTTNMTMFVTNNTVVSSSFDSVAAGDYTSGQSVNGWAVDSSQVSVVTDPTVANGGSSNYLTLANGELSYALPAGITNGTYSLTFAYRGPGIIGWWRGEGNALDSVGSNNGALMNGATYAGGEVGQAFSFLGSSAQYVQAPDSDLWAFGTNDFSIELWAYFQTLPTGSIGQPTSGNAGIFISNDEHSTLFNKWWFGLTGGVLNFHINDPVNGPIWLVRAPFAPILQHWYDFTITRKDFVYTIYVDGVAVGSETNNRVIPNPAAPLQIGQAEGFYFNGRIDEASIYQRALSTSEIKAIYQNGSAGKFDPAEFNISPTASLAEANMTVSGVSTNLLLGNNSWQTYSVSGSVPINGATLAVAGFEPGMLLDSVVLTNTIMTMTNVTATFMVTNVITNSTYLTFTEDTNLTTTPIKYAVPPFGSTNQSVVWLNTTNVGNFEVATNGNYVSGSTVDGWSVVGNQVSVMTDSANAASGSNLLALADGSISRVLPTVAGETYALTYACRGPGIAGLWRGENNANDAIYGNNGTAYGSAYTGGEVGQAFLFNYSFMGNRVQIPDATTYELTNSLSIEGWVEPTGIGHTGTILWRGDNRPGYDPYFLQVNSDNTLGFYIEDASGAAASGVNTANPLAAGQWYHVAATLDGVTGNMSIYVNGVLVAQTNTAVRPFGQLIAGDDPCLGIGNVGTAIWHDVALQGNVDEVSLYTRALSASEVKAIYNAGSAGKFDSTNSFPLNLAEARVAVGGVSTNMAFGSNTTWQTNTITFTATQNGTPIQITGLQPGVLLDSFALAKVQSASASDLYYQPEQSLDPLLGTSAYGLWQLEILDNREGATNNANLVSWQLQFTFANTNFTLTTITNGFPGSETNYIPGHSIQWYLVNVPTNADYATNTLIFANLPLNLWWSTNEPPTTTNVPPDAEILAGSTGGNAVLGTNGSPVNMTTAFIIPGGKYYLGVENPNNGGTYYAVDVTFHLLTGQLPSVITKPATNIVTGSATLNASVNPLGTNATVYFEYGLTTNYGFFSTNIVLTSNLNQSQWVPINVTNIAPPGSVWHFQAIATNIYGTNFGGDLTFTNPYNTPPPFAFTMPATRINGSSAQFNGMATPNGAPSIAWFEWGTSTRYSFTTPPVNVGTNFNVVYVTNFLSSFQTNVAFHYRLVVSNGVAVTYGFDQIFAEGSVVTWGADFFGQTTPIPAGLTNLVAGVGAGFDFSLALNYDGSVVAWGNDTLGQTNVPAGLKNAVAVAGGYSHALALRSDRTVTAWGDDTDGQTDVPPALTNAVAAASGAYHNLALRDNGNLVTWGLNSSGQASIPAGLSNVVAVAAGYSHSLALKNDGTVVAWGNNAHGETDVPAGLTNVVAIAAGNYDSMALRSNGTVVVWGYNANGQTNVPVSLTNVTAIAAGGYHCLALKGDGSVWFWGDSSSGQLNNYPTNLVNNIFTIAGGGFHTVAVSAPYGLNVTNTPPYWTNGLDGTTNTMDELTVATINNAALDSNSPPQLVFYSLLNPPAFASIDSFSGVITLNPQEVDGPSTNTIITVATDNGYPTLSATNRFTLIVNEVNTPPFWPSGVPNPTNYVIGVGSVLTVNNTASDSDIPANTLSYAISVSPAANAPTINNGIIHWTPQTAGNFTLTTVVTDDNPWALANQNLSATNYITVTVTNSVTPPPIITTNISSIIYTNINGTNGFLLTWFAPSNQLFQVQCTTNLSPVVWLTFTNIISYNPNYPADATNATFTFFDDGSQIPFGATRFYRVILYNPGGGNTPPVLPVIGTQTVNPLNPLTVTNTATDSDTPPQTLTYTLNTTVTGTNQPVINPSNGIITWTPDVSQGGTSNYFTTIATDDGVPSLSATNSFAVIVNPVPDFTSVNYTNGSFLLTWLAPTNDIFTVQVATNLASPTVWLTLATNIVYTGPVTPTNGWFSYLDDPATTTVPFGSIRFYRLILARVNLPTNPPSGNTAPVLPVIGTQTVNPLNPLTVTNTATDSDTPPQTLTYTLSTTVTGTNQPVINPASGIITWTPDVSQGGTSNYFTTIVTDDGVPSLSATNSFAVIVNPVPDFTSVNYTNGSFLLTWLAPTNDIFTVQVATNLASPTVWLTLATNIVYTGPVTPTNGWFSYLDDPATTTVPFGSIRFYRLILARVNLPTNPPAVPTTFPISVVPTNGNFVLTWTAPSTNQFKVLWTTNISSPITWTPFTDTITSSNGTFMFTDTNLPAALKFYQLMLLP